VDLLESFLKDYKAGSPTDSNVYWISLTRSQIRRLFAEKHQIQLSSRSIRQGLNRLGYRYRKIQKDLATGSCDQREAQFQLIFETVAEQSLQTPILSIDCKKKELLGNLYRDGKCYTIGQQKAFDHDFPSLGKGKVVPHGIYDLQSNQGFITIGNSCETAGFIIDNLRWWWLEFGRFQYPKAPQIVLLCDAGGGNSYRHHAFKKELQRFAHEIKKDLLVCHYPPYASKWNPIEHRLFCHVHKAMSGQMFQNYETVQQLIENTRTDTGLTVKARILLKEYPKGLKTLKSEIDSDRIQFHETLPKLCLLYTSPSPRDV
jgi:hypothetical protein